MFRVGDEVIVQREPDLFYSVGDIGHVLEVFDDHALIHFDVFYQRPVIGWWKNDRKWFVDYESLQPLSNQLELDL